MKKFLTFLTHLVLCFQMPFNQVTDFFYYCRIKIPFSYGGLSCLQFLFIKRKCYLFNFLYWSHGVPLIMAIHSSGKIINGLITVVAICHSGFILAKSFHIK